MKHIIYLSVFILLVACNTTQSQNNPKDFNSYWYAGEAEISSYKLQQARYGEAHSGTAVLVYVTEPFSKSKQVKLNNWKDSSSDNISVLKLNFTKKFLTGIYPYSMMSSSFTPIDDDQYPNPIKITTSSQEWCGHTFMQMNLRDDNYALETFSYFESEGDIETNIDKTLLEDEIWSRIRLNPSELPIGKINILPGTFYLRLKHQTIKALTANATKEQLESSDFSDKKHKKYTLEYSDRTLAIYYESSFPYTILGWEETYMSGFRNPEKLTTVAKRINTIKSPYWGKNNTSDRVLREELGLGTE